MTRTRSVVRCRGIYRLRDTSRERKRPREGGREGGGGGEGVQARASKKRPRFIAGKFPSWRCSQKWWRTGQRRRRGAGVFLRASHSPPDLRSFLIRRVVIRKRDGHPFTADSVSERSVAGSLFYRIKDVAGHRRPRRPQNIVNARLKNSWARVVLSQRRWRRVCIILEEICKMASCAYYETLKTFICNAHFSSVSISRRFVQAAN